MSFPGERNRMLVEYYSAVDRKQDRCWHEIRSGEYGILDHCDIFENITYQGTVLALYIPEESVEVFRTPVMAKYPCHNFVDSAYSFYGLKLNILAFLSGIPIDRLLLFYGENRVRPYQRKEIFAHTVLDHYNLHFRRREPETVPVEHRPTITMNIFKP